MGVHYTINSQVKKKSFFLDLSLTAKLVIINVFLFLAFLIADFFLESNFGIYGFIENYIAISRESILSNFYIWTVFTSMFMHGGFFHLFVNMLSLFFIGSLLEKIVGKKRFFWFYIFAGVFAGFLHILFETSPAVGASGALFGLIGVLIFLTPNLPVYMMFIPIPIKMKYAAPAMLILLWIVSLGLNLPIGNFAHLGGLLFGLVYGFYLKKKYPRKVQFISRQFS